MLLLDETAVIGHFATLVATVLLLMSLALGISGLWLIIRPAGSSRTLGTVFLVLAMLLLVAASKFKDLAFT